MLGSLVISSKGVPNQLDRLPGMDVCGQYGQRAAREGSHTPGRNNGLWTMSDEDCISFEVYIPQRDKLIQVSQRGGSVSWEPLLSTIDAGVGTQLSKLASLKDQLPTDVEFVVMNSEGDHGSFSLIPKSRPLALVGVEHGRTIHLVWADTTDLVELIRQYYPAQLSLFRFPIITEPLFIHTQAVCSKWYRWNTSFGGDTFRCFNCLEVMLYKGVINGHR